MTARVPHTPSPSRSSAENVSGMEPSTMSISLANRLTILPLGFVSKKAMGARRTAASMVLWRWVDAARPPTWFSQLSVEQEGRQVYRSDEGGEADEDSGQGAEHAVHGEIAIPQPGPAGQGVVRPGGQPHVRSDTGGLSKSLIKKLQGLRYWM